MGKVYAPILIPTLCRYKHFIRLIESLKKNSYAKYTDVYIGLDYPASENHKYGYDKICEYLENDFSEFASFNIVRRKENLGSAKNMSLLRNYVLSKYDRFIRTDDDAEFSPNFLEYMNVCLDKFEQDPNVVAITGYTYPIQWKVASDSTVFKENFIFPMWGTGFWKNKLSSVMEFIEDGDLFKKAESIIDSSRWENMIETAKCEYIELCLSPDFKETLAAKFSDISMNMYLAVNDKYIIVPTLSKVRNWGFDGSGEYCKKGQSSYIKSYNAYNYPYHMQKIDENLNFLLKLDTLNAVRHNKIIMNKFDVLPWRRHFKAYIKLLLFRMLGREYMFKFLRLFRRQKYCL